MEDVTPLNLEDSPKLFGLRYDQLVAILASFLVATQLYSWMDPTNFCGQDLRLDVSVFFGLIGPGYALATLHSSSGNWENLLNYYFASQILIPGPDPNPVRFLTDEQLPDFCE
jgi:hypothetical protein